MQADSFAGADDDEQITQMEEPRARRPVALCDEPMSRQAVSLSRPHSLGRTRSIEAMSGILHGSLRGLSRHNSFSGRALSECEEAVFRQAYEEAVEAEGARAVLVEVAQQLDARLGSERSATPFTWTLQTDDTPPQTFTFSSCGVVTIGRPGYRNDVGIREKPAALPSDPPCCSRVHVVVVPLEDSLVLCDVGSLAGFRITERNIRANADAEAKAPAAPPPARRETNEDVSAPGQRRPLLVGAAETAVVQLEPRGRTVVINPCDCLICCDVAREVRFNCGHFVCCSVCARRVARCPVCRAPIVSTETMHATKSFPPAAYGM